MTPAKRNDLEAALEAIHRPFDTAIVVAIADGDHTARAASVSR